MSGPVLVLVGPPGAGKSVVGRAVAERLGVEFVDTDAAVGARAGNDVGAAFVDLGEERFRQLEAEVVREALTTSGVVAIGGGAVTAVRPQLERCAAAGTAVVFLDVSLSAAASRVGLNVPRSVALGNARAQLSAMLEERRPGYAAVATAVVETADREVAEVVDAVLDEIAHSDGSSSTP
ncbi:shikimate kinase [Georgenia deserti]|uniref:Shikimate kinase n=1 Tax=Georgenia deserti TaxID=2093781 RepID=A0ABW4L6W0_9MICO